MFFGVFIAALLLVSGWLALSTTLLCFPVLWVLRHRVGCKSMGSTVEGRLTELRDGLLRIHKTLLESERAVYERDVEKITSPGQMLGLVMNDPWFAWLHELSMFVVSVDEKLDAKDAPVAVAEATKIFAEARELLTPDERGQGFRLRYFEAMQRDPDVIFAHREISRLLTRLSE
ncbi:MAG: hypothetical protein WKF37_01660 [Bryobacteraceae bacterium]